MDFFKIKFISNIWNQFSTYNYEHERMLKTRRDLDEEWRKEEQRNDHEIETTGCLLLSLS
jgi:hypothetical protein